MVVSWSYNPRKEHKSDFYIAETESRHHIHMAPTSKHGETILNFFALGHVSLPFLPETDMLDFSSKGYDSGKCTVGS